jgi:hypothetical protein
MKLEENIELIKQFHAGIKWLKEYIREEFMYEFEHYVDRLGFRIKLTEEGEKEFREFSYGRERFEELQELGERLHREKERLNHKEYLRKLGL